MGTGDIEENLFPEPPRHAIWLGKLPAIPETAATPVDRTFMSMSRIRAGSLPACSKKSFGAPWRAGGGLAHEDAFAGRCGTPCPASQAHRHARSLITAGAPLACPPSSVCHALQFSPVLVLPSQPGDTPYSPARRANEPIRRRSQQAPAYAIDIPGSKSGSVRQRSYSRGSINHSRHRGYGTRRSAWRQGEHRQRAA